MIPQSYAKRRCSASAAIVACAIGSTSVFGSLDEIGVTQLRAEVPWLTGNGIIVAQPEATRISWNPFFDYDNFEINPSAANVPITYINKSGVVVSFDSAYESGHADAVAGYMAGAGGVATGLSGIVNLNANYYIDHIVAPNNPIIQSPQVVNQSFIMVNPQAPFTADVLNQMWDSFAAKHKYIIVSGAGNGGPVQVPATAYNVIAVGAYGGGSSVSQSGQRAKPDITAPAGATSYSAPLVSGAAALLLQASQNASYVDGSDPRVVKALLLNGAVKPADWTHDSAVPLDRRYGAGVLNVYYSYQNLMAGELGAVPTTKTALGSHPPISNGDAGNAGWNLRTLGSTETTDGVDHYVLDLSEYPVGVPMILTATLTWQRAADDALTNEIIATQGTVSSFTSAINTINNLDLYLYNSGTRDLVDQSVSTIDNVEHIYSVNLTPAKYDLQVVKNGGVTSSPSETYGMAWNAASITAVKSVTNNKLLTFAQTSALSVSAEILGTGTLTQSGIGTTTLTGAANYGGPTVISTGKLVFGGTGVAHGIGTVSGGGTLQVAGGSTLTSKAVNMPSGTLSVDSVHVIAAGSGVSVVSVLKLGGSGPSNWTGKLDLMNNDLIVRNGGDVARQIFQAANLGNWNASLSGITSSTVAASLNPKLALAYATGQEYYDATPSLRTSFDGVAVVSTDELVMVTLAGDANMDGSVNFADISVLQINYNGTNRRWVQGDFNYDGYVNFADFALMQNNYGSLLNVTSLNQPAETNAFAFSVSAFPNTIPEPTCLVIFGLGMTGLLVRRDRMPLRKEQKHKQIQGI